MSAFNILRLMILGVLVFACIKNPSPSSEANAGMWCAILILTAIYLVEKSLREDALEDKKRMAKAPEPTVEASDSPEFVSRMAAGIHSHDALPRSHGRRHHSRPDLVDRLVQFFALPPRLRVSGRRYGHRRHSGRRSHRSHRSSRHTAAVTV